MTCYLTGPLFYMTVHTSPVSRRRPPDGMPATLLILFVALALTLPSLFAGLKRDDYYHKALLTGTSPFHETDAVSPLDASGAAASLFAFIGPDRPEIFARAQATGLIPWWADERLEIQFWRPVTALTHWLDYQLWPDSPLLMHAQNVAWYLLLLLAWAACLKRLGLSGWPFVVALALYALDSSYADAVGWIANRNILLASTCGFAALALYIDSVRQRRVALLTAACLLVLVSLLAAEGGIAIVGLLGAYALVLDQRPWWQRLAWVAPVVAVTLGWRLVYAQLGYSAAYSGVYLDPATSTTPFLHNLAQQLPLLAMDQITGIESAALLMSPQTLNTQIVIAWVFLLLFVLTLLPLFRQQPLTRFLLLGAALALMPAGSTLLTGGRVMFMPGAALSALLACFLTGVVLKTPWLPRARAYRIWAWIAVIGLVLGTIAGNGFIWYLNIASQLADKKIARYADLLSAYDGTAETIIAVNPPVQFDLMYVREQGKALGLAIPPTIRTLAPGTGSFSLTRLDTHSLRVTAAEDALDISSRAPFPPGGPVFSLWNAGKRLDTFFAGHTYTRQPGQMIALPGVTITIEHTDARGLPRQVHFRFEQPLESARYQWQCWDQEQHQYGLCPLPAPGETRTFRGLLAPTSP